MRKYIFLLLFLLIPFKINAEEVEYTLFDTNINVNIDRTLDVDENYRLYFINDTKNISRKIKNSTIINRPNNKKLFLDTRVSNIKSITPFVVEKKNNTNNIILDVDGIQDNLDDYNLKYQYDLGKDYLKDNDEFYFKLVEDVDAPISNYTFTIKFPTNIEKYKFKFAIDDKYNLTKDDISYTIDDDTITGSLNILLNPKQSLSIYVELPDNYFKNTNDNFNYKKYLLILFPFISTLIIGSFFIKYGLGIKVKIKRTKEIFNNFDSSEIGYLYKGKLEEMDLTSTILYLASKGYLQIVEHDDGYKLGKDNTFHFIKLKDYDKNNAIQEIIFNELFRNRNVVELKDIEYHFADTFKEALSMLNNEDNHKKLFFDNLKLIKIISMSLIVLSIIVANFNSIYLLTNSYLLILPIILVMLFGLYVSFLSKMRGLLKIILSIIIVSFSIYVGFTPILIHNHLLIIYIIEVILIISMLILYTRLSDRTIYGIKMLSETYGIKYYLESITKQELESNISENPNYYFDMIPYAYVLDCLEVWIKKGKDIITTNPNWYIPSGEFKLNNFEKFIKNVLYTTTLVMMRQLYSTSELVTYENTKVKTNLND